MKSGSTSSELHVLDPDASEIVTEALLNQDHKDQVNYDVKIGDGMDIAIHGENGE
jgi:hypothetical protein